MSNFIASERSAAPGTISPDNLLSGMAQVSSEAVPGDGRSNEGSIAARVLRRPRITASLFFALGLLIFLPGVSRPVEMHYDEPYFIPEARTFLLRAPNPSTQLPPPL